MGYYKITEKQIMDVMLNVEISISGVHIIRPSDLVYLLNTSRYQVNKYIKVLKNKGVIEYKSRYICDGYDEDFQIINGYELTEKGKIEYKKELDERVQKRCKDILLNEIINLESR